MTLQRFMRNQTIEDVTAQRLRECEETTDVTVTLPAPIENLVEQVLGLALDWDMIEQQQPGGWAGSTRVIRYDTFGWYGRTFTEAAHRPYSRWTLHKI